jgi:hypothetical protein
MLKPDGRLLLVYASARSWHGLASWLHERRGGPGGVEYVLAPDPNLGPWEALAPGEVSRLVTEAGLRVIEARASEAAPTRTEVDHRTRNMRGARRALLRGGAAAARALAALPGAAAALGRTRTLLLQRR